MIGHKAKITVDDVILIIGENNISLGDYNQLMIKRKISNERLLLYYVNSMASVVWTM